MAEKLRAILSRLYMLMVQAHDYQGSGTQHAMTNEIKGLIQDLLALTQASRRLPTYLPLDIIQYVERGKNPDIYTREFVELVMKLNQVQKGRSQGYADFRDILAKEMASAIPDMREDVRSVVHATGGKLE